MDQGKYLIKNPIEQKKPRPGGGAFLLRHDKLGALFAGSRRTQSQAIIWREFKPLSFLKLSV